MVNSKPRVEKTKKSKLKPGKNKGEWAELYIGLRALDDELIDLYNSIKKIKVLKIGYDFGRLMDKSQIHQLKNEIQKLKLLLSQEKGVFDIKNNSLIETVGFKKSSPNNKSDIFLNYILDSNEVTGGFSVKSRLNSSPSILNASQGTNFVFKINAKELSSLLEIDSLRTLVRELCKGGNSIVFSHCFREKFTNNLKLVDSQMAEMLADVLLNYYAGDFTKLKDVVDNYVDAKKRKMYEARLKDFLFYIVCGMNPTKQWDGKLKIHGCILLEKKNNLMALHTLELDNFKEYLYEHMRFDTASRSKHKFGQIYDEKNEKFLKLNLLFRLT